MSSFSYLSFDLVVGTTQGSGYPLMVVSSPAGQGRGVCALDPKGAELTALLQQNTTAEGDEATLPILGQRLFQALFSGEVGALFRASLGQARGQKQGLRLRLGIEAPELAALPWEYLYDPHEDRFLAISPETPVVRHLPLMSAVRPTAVAPPLRVLVVLANPLNVMPLDVAREQALIEAALGPLVEAGRVAVKVLPQGIIAEITQAMRSFGPHVFHFVGHAQFEGDGAAILLEDEAGMALPLGERAFRELFLGAPNTRLAVLNACQSATRDTKSPLVGLAPRLLQRDLSAVVAMQAAFPDEAALIFTREFYRSVALGLPLEVALAEARKGILLERPTTPHEWGIPVLYLRAPDGQLFEVALEPPPESSTKGVVTMDVDTLAKDVLPLLVGHLKGEANHPQSAAIYGAVQQGCAQSPTAQEALVDLSHTPTDEDAQAAVRLQLKKLLRHDQALAGELTRLLALAQNSAAPSLSATNRGVVVGGQNSGTIVTAGDISGSLTIGGGGS